MRDIWADYVPPSPKGPRAVLFFGCQPYGANTDKCEHIHPRGPINPDDGSSIMGACCHKFGKENHASLRRDPRTDPKPEPKPKPKKLTRKESRALKAAEKAKQVRP